MNNNNVGRISIKTAKRPRSRFNLAHDVNTTCGFGEVQPLLCREVVPGTKSVFNVESLVRLSPIIAPAYGRLKMRLYHYFVGMSDLSRNFSAFLAKQSVARGINSFVPSLMPSMTMEQLTAFCLTGAKCTLYDITSNGDDSGDVSDATLYKWSKALPVGTPGMLTLWNAVNNSSGEFADGEFYEAHHNMGDFEDSWLGYTDAPAVNLGKVFGWQGDLWVPSANAFAQSFFDVQIPEVKDDTDFAIYDLDSVPLDVADLVVQRQVGGRSIAFAFRFSAAGKRLAKILIGCGYQLDAGSSDSVPVSLMPLFAFYKAYFDNFGLTLYQHIEDTNLFKLLNLYDNEDEYNFASYVGTTSGASESVIKIKRVLISFFADLMACFYTEEKDFVSIHTRTTAVSRSSSLPDAPGAGQINEDLHITQGNYHEEAGQVNTHPSQAHSPHAFINNVLHTELDAEYLKKLYQWTNRNTIAGQRIADLLRAQGLGEYVDNCDSRFIGGSTLDIHISDVVAQSDTFKDGAGSLLGEYGAKGIGYDRSKKFTYVNGEFGFVITLCAIVPESGFCQSIDPAVLNRELNDFPQPDFDGMGHELNNKGFVSGALPWSAKTMNHPVNQSFGFAPRYTRFKVQHNKINGDFALRGTRSTYLPFTLDKIVDIGERSVFKVDDDSTQSEFEIRKLLTPDNTPIASPNWGFIGRYPWLGKFARIFYNLGLDKYATYSEYYKGQTAAGLENPLYYWILNFYDNFIVQNRIDLVCYMPMLPIEDSFETREEGNKGTSDISIGKA